MRHYDAAVIGGGLSGLTSSIYLAKAGLSVVLSERANQLGGRSATVKKNGAMLNLGLHALYKGGAAEEVLNELRIPVKGATVPAKGGIVWNDKLYPLPGNPFSIVTSNLLSASAKLEIVSFVGKLAKIDTNALPPISFREWVEKEIRDPTIRRLIYAVCRTNTFVPYPEILLAAPAVRRLQLVFKGNQVLYVDQGWGQLVERLRQEAIRAGVTIWNRKGVSAIEHDGRVRQIRFSDGETLEVPNVVVAAGPGEACKLVTNAEQTSLKEWRDRAKPIYAACLDVALRRLPYTDDPKRHFTFFLDQPIFISTPSVISDASEDGSAIIHVCKDIGFGSDHPQNDESQLERALDFIQPGWQKELVARQFLPKMTVAHDFDSMDRIGRRYGPSVPEVRGLYVSGDWTGQGEVLVDAVFASARRASEEILRDYNHKGGLAYG
ncbi:phytoene desaturase family protein [Paenibacillus flagellatus]|uniref:Dehydrogenase n=1 Tax=Paenibacillus flagellatus TaxID=2211139 RepID=A0A2V5KFN9_9BACL|nr:FAD-dependent oxidoreductase [Paenibacillus flagellatus]PYI57324.1 dehydrogenase [Paenibacillus flagellatus]